MPSKKKKYNSRFPPARIKKIMQTDDEIGKVAAAVPVLISKCLEMFLTSILTSAGEVTKQKRAKTMSTSHLKECIMNVAMFDFLKDIVAEVPDMQNEEEPSTSGVVTHQENKKPTKRRQANNSNVPRKRVKFTVHEVNEEDEDDQDSPNEDEQNGLVMASGDEPSEPRSTTAEEKGSFHISLDALMSPPNDPSIPRGQVAAIVGTETNEACSKVPDALVNYSAISDEKPDSSNGISSPQKPMDLTVNSSENREQRIRSEKTQPQNIDPTGRVDNSHHLLLGPAAGASGSSPTTMPPLYNTMTALPPAPPVTAALPKDLNAKMPQGSMLSFLYSGLPGEPGIPTRPDSRRVSARDQTKPSSSDPLYPYNPVAEHYKRMAPISYAPGVSSLSSTIGAPQSRVRLVKEDDDDYDN